MMEPVCEHKHTLIWIPGFFDTSLLYLPLLQKSGMIDKNTRVFSFQSPLQKQHFLGDGKLHTGFYQVYRRDDKAILINKDHFYQTIDYIEERVNREVELMKGETSKVTLAGFS